MFFSEFFFHKRKLCIVWNWFIAKNTLILVLRLCKMAANQSALGLNRDLSSNFWWLRCVNHVNTEECVIFTEKYILVKNCLEMDLPLWPQLKKQSMEWKHTDFLVKKKFQAQQSVIKVILTVLLDMKGSMIIDFLKTVKTVNRASYCKSFDKIDIFYWTNFVYIYIYIYIYACV